jgi:hypothetical protein
MAETSTGGSYYFDGGVLIPVGLKDEFTRLRTEVERLTAQRDRLLEACRPATDLFALGVGAMNAGLSGGDKARYDKLCDAAREIHRLLSDAIAFAEGRTIA